MSREERRALKRARSSKFNRAAPATPLTTTVEPVTVPPGGIPIFWCVPTGRKFYHRGYKCENNHYQQQPCSAEDYANDPISGAVPCSQCELTARCWSAGSDTEMLNTVTGELYAQSHKMPPGAVYEHFVYNGEAHNWVTNNGQHLIHRANEQDGRILCCVLPDGHSWTIDSRANNCCSPDDDQHWCWNRSGRPEDGTLDVRKGKPGQTTCSAGGGSIQTGRWHGFLHNGRLVQA